ncbi:MAG: cobalt-precorrin 5A hydrolase [Methanoregula sp.]|jgi:cobalt-precorrin 5A hydrolase
MTGTIVIALPRFAGDAKRIAGFLDAEFREYSPTVFAEVFPTAKRIVALMSMGIAMRSIAPLLHDKWNDPAVVVVSPDLAWAIPLVGGHHGANDLAKELSGLGIQPVITTATEATGRDSVEGIAKRTSCGILNHDSTRKVNAAILDGNVKIHSVSGPSIVIAGPDVSLLVRKGEYAVGIGCRKDAGKDTILAAIKTALDEAGIDPGQVMIYATTAKKCHEAGLIDAIAALSANLIFLDDDTINAQTVVSSSQAKKIGLLGVAEPCALAVAEHKEMVMNKHVYGSVTIAIAR